MAKTLATGRKPAVRLVGDQRTRLAAELAAKYNPHRAGIRPLARAHDLSHGLARELLLEAGVPLGAMGGRLAKR